MRTLRARLTLLYVVVAGGVFLTFGMLSYGMAGVLLMRSVDRMLADTARQVLPRVHPQEGGQLTVTASGFYVPGVVVQVWDRTGRRVATIPVEAQVQVPVVPIDLGIHDPTYMNRLWRGQTWRVLSVPVIISERRWGAVEVMMPLTLIAEARRDVLLGVLGAMGMALFFLGMVGYFGVQLALEPLAHVSALAEQITHADDLGRRLTAPPGAGDEVRTLVRAFNATLARLEALFRAQRRFVADVGHELRTPLTVIKGNAQWMRRIGQLDPEALDSIEEETDRLSRLVDDLLLLASAEAGKLPLRRAVVDLDAVSADVLREIQVVARDKVRFEADLAPVRVCGDADRLKQVLLNLVSNAVKYTPSGGKVSLTVGEEGQWAVCQVRDTGPGIPPEDLPHVFERFYRADKARSRGHGFGLGLPIAYWIVKHHGGRITVASELGKGTTFTVYLPRVEASGAVEDCEA